MNVARRVLVLGSGGAGLAAALAAARHGCTVQVLERAPLVGGTTAVSGGGLWVPGAAAAVAAGVTTPLDDVRDYLTTLAGERVDRAAVEAYLARGPGVLDAIAAATPLQWQHSGYPDYHTGLRGSSAAGHCVEAPLLDGHALLGSALGDVRTSPFYPAPFTLAEVMAGGGMAGFWTRVDRAELRDRRQRGLIGMGRALAAGLYAGCLAAGVQVRTGVRAMQPLMSAGAVRGVVSDEGTEFRAGAVVVATGGFEWDERLSRAWLAGPPLAPASPPFNTGDGIRLGSLAGGAVGNTQEAWWYPVIELPGDQWPEGAPRRRLTFGERTNPHSLMVDRDGRRFVNESASYHVVGRTMLAPHPTGVGWAHAPAWLVFDTQHRRRYRVQTVGPDDPDPDWLRPAPSLAELAAREGIDGQALVRTVGRFNDMATGGRDEEFGRGAAAHDRLIGDASADHPCLGPVTTPPFYALRVLPGTIGTKGGLAVDPDGRVLNPSGKPVPGLYAGSNAIANVTGEGYPGAGGTLGPAVVSGWVAGDTAGQAA